MSDITFIVANKRANSGVGDSVVGSKYFADCTVSISHNFSNSVTEHPVEDGASFSDHSQVRNARFQVSGIFSSIPLNQYGGDQLPYRERIQAAYSFLLGLRNNKTRFTLVSKYDVYPNCTIEILDIPVGADSQSSLFFDMSIVQMRTASTQLVNIVQTDNVADFKKDDASKTQNGGKKNTTNERESIAFQINQSADQATDLVSNIFGVSKEDAEKAIVDGVKPNGTN